MKFVQLHSNAQLPTKGSEAAGAYDVYMTEDGEANEHTAIKVGLGFAAKVPDGYVAQLMPRSGVGFKHGVELNNTCGIIDADYTGEWFASIKTKAFPGFKWKAGDRVLQYLLVPVLDSPPEWVPTLPPTTRGAGGLGSSGN